MKYIGTWILKLDSSKINKDWDLRKYCSQIDYLLLICHFFRNLKLNWILQQSNSNLKFKTHKIKISWLKQYTEMHLTNNYQSRLNITFLERITQLASWVKMKSKKVKEIKVNQMMIMISYFRKLNLFLRKIWHTLTIVLF